MNRTRSGSGPSRPDLGEAGPELELVWRGKYDADGVRTTIAPRAIALETIEICGEADTTRGELVWGDNLDALDGWLPRHRGAVDLAYIDPPFSTGSEFPVLTRVRDADGTARVLAQPAYTDRWAGGDAAYLAMLAPRLERIHTLLADHGSLYVHVDPTVGHAVRLLLDEVFGARCFQREIIWRIGWVSGFKTRARNWIRNHDTILFYAKDPKRMRFNKVYVPHPEGYARRAGVAAKAPGMAVDDVWNAGSGDLALVGPDALDSIQIKSFSREKTGYATQKNESLLRRIVAASSNPGDLVLDAFGGAGTTAVVAAAMGRRFLVSDMGDAAIQLSRTRLRRSAPGLGWSLAVPRLAGSAGCEPTPLVVERAAPRRWRVRSEPGRDASTVTLAIVVDRTGRAGITIEDVELGPHAPAQLGEAIAAGVDPVRECAIDWAASDAILRPNEVRIADATTAIDRTFVSPAALVSRTRVLLQIVDLGFACTRIVLEIAPGRTWQVRAWWSRPSA